MKISTCIAILVSLLTVVEAGHGGRGGDVKPKSGNGGKQKAGKSGSNHVKSGVKAGSGGKGPQAKAGNAGTATGGGSANAAVGFQSETIIENCSSGSTCNYGPVTEGAQSGGYAMSGGGTSTGGSATAKGNGGRGPVIKNSGNSKASGLRTGAGGSNSGANSGGTSANGATGGQGGKIGVTASPTLSIPPPVRRDIDPSAEEFHIHKVFKRSAYALPLDEIDSTSNLEPVTQADMVRFAEVLLTNSEAADDFVEGMNSNTLLYENIAELDPTIKPQGFVKAKEISKVVQLLADSPAAQNAVKDSINENPPLAQYLADFRAQHQGSIESRDLLGGGWDDLYDQATLRRRWDKVHVWKRWVAAVDEFGSLAI